MGYIGLLLAFTVGWVCLSQDRRQNTDVSWGLTLSTIWMMRVASRAFGYWLPASLQTSGDPVILTVLTCLGLLVLARRGAKVGAVLKDSRAFLLFFLFMTASVFWTADFFDTFKRWFRLVGDVTMVLIVLTEARPFNALLTVLRRSMLF